MKTALEPRLRKRKKQKKNQSGFFIDFRNCLPNQRTMRFLFSLLKLAFFLLLLLLVIGLFLPSSGHVERSIVIPQVPEVPFNLVNCLKDWEKWSPWHKMDKQMKIRYSGPPEGKGASYDWTSDHDKVGNGRQTIVDSRPAEYVLMDMEFAEGGPARCGFYFLKTQGGTEVKWTIDSDAGWNLPARYFILLMDYFVGPHFEDGLASLSAESAKVALKNFSMGFSENEMPALRAVGIPIVCRQQEMGERIQSAYGIILEALPALQLQVAGPPFALYEGEPSADGIFRLTAGMPVDKKPVQAPPTGISFFELPARKSLLCTFNGPYSQIGRAYERFPFQLKARKLTPAGSPLESYLNDPASAKNPLEIRTRIYWPVR